MSEPLRKINRESPVEQVKRLEAEAKQLARTAADILISDLALISMRCVDIGGLLSLPPGLRELLPRLGQQISDTLETAKAIDARSV